MHTSWRRLEVSITRAEVVIGVFVRSTLRTFARYHHSFALMLVVPLIPFALTVLFTGLAWIWSRTIAKRSLGGFRMQFMLDDTAQLRAYFLSWLAASIPFVHIIYNGICMKVFNSLSCFRLRDGTTVLSIAPDIVCWDSAQHRAMVAFSIIAILVYVIGIPAYVFCSLRYAKRTDQLKDAEWLQVLGFLYYRYGARSPSSGVPCPSMDRQGPLEHWVLMQSLRTTCGSSRSSAGGSRSAHAQSACGTIRSHNRCADWHCAPAATAVCCLGLRETNRALVDVGGVRYRHFYSFPIHEAVWNRSTSTLRIQPRSCL